MRKIIVKTCPGFEEWREKARICLQEGRPPDQIIWGNDCVLEEDLFLNHLCDFLKPLENFTVPREFVDLASLAICHNSPGRFSLLYRILWRLCHDNKNLLRYKTDDDILKLNACVKAVHRDAYKIKAFLRFRKMQDSQEEYFIAWYEPEHYSLELALPFFQTRFKNMTWSILTPYLAAYWDRQTLAFCKNPDSTIVPQEDEVEKYWLKYYASTFNPARPKKSAMLNQMPMKYWKNMPETVLIKDLLRHSEARTRKMIDEGNAGSIQS